MSVDLQRKRLNLAKIHNAENTYLVSSPKSNQFNSALLDLLDTFPSLSYGLVKSIFSGCGENYEKCYIILREIIDNQLLAFKQSVPANNHKRSFANIELYNSESDPKFNNFDVKDQQISANEGGNCNTLINNRIFAKSIAALVGKITSLKNELEATQKQCEAERQARICAENRLEETRQSVNGMFQDLIVNQQHSQFSFNAFQSHFDYDPKGHGSVF